MTIVRTEGVILQTLTFKEADQILTVLTPEGIIKLIYKGALSRKRGGGSLTSPLQQAEFVYSRRKSEIASCREISVLNAFLNLRQKLIFLESAGEMASSLLISQHGDTPMPMLYKLFILYMKSIPEAKDPFLLSASLKLKVLYHEGLLALQPLCAVCKQSIQEVNIHAGECYCKVHAPTQASFFNAYETNLLLLCTYGRSIKKLAEQTGDACFFEKVKKLYKFIYS